MRLLMLLLFVFSLVGCNQDRYVILTPENGENSNQAQQLNDKTNKVERLPASERNDEYKGFTLIVTDETSVNDQYQFTYMVPSNEPLKPTITLANDHEKALTYRFMFLLDYKQTSVQFKGEQREYVDVKVPGFSKKQLSQITFNNLPKGVHQLMIIMFRAPEQHVKDKDQYVKGEQVVLLRRITLFVGEREKTEQRDIPYRFIDSKPVEKTGGMISYITHKPFVPIKKVIGTVSDEDQPLWFNFIVQKDNTPYFIGMFIGNELVQLEQPFVKVKEKGLASVKLNVDIDQYQEKENLFVFAVPNPYKIRLFPDGTIKKELSPYYVHPSNIVTLYPGDKSKRQ